MREYRTYQCPTLVLRSFFADTSAMNNFASHPYIDYYPEEFKKQLLRSYQTFFNIRRPADIDRSNLLLTESLRQVFEMHSAGIPLLAGTDMPGFGTFPGISLHDELHLFVKAGLSPFEALKTATVNPSRYLGLEKELGTIERGKLADLVLLDETQLTILKILKRSLL